MNYVYLIFIILAIWLNLKTNNGYFRPSVFFMGGFCCAFTVLAINSRNWDYTLSFKTFFMIFLSMFFFFCGEFFSLKISRKNKRIYNPFIVKFSLKRNQIFWWLGLILAIALLIYRIASIRTVIAMYGQGNYILENYRAYGTGEDSISISIKFLESTVSVFSFYYVVVFFLSKEKIKKKIKNLIPIILYTIQCILSASRSNVLRIIFICTLLWIFIKNNQQNIKLKFKTKRNLIIIFIFAMLFFAFLGNLTGKTQKLGVIDSLSIYTGGSLPALDIFIRKYAGSPQFGYYTLQGVRRILELLGVDIVYKISYFSHGDFIHFGMYKTNVYSCFRNYLIDYGYIGSIVLMFIFGYIFGLFYDRRIKKHSSLKYYDITIYSVLIFYVFFSFVTERIFSQILTATTIFEILLYFVIFSRNPVEKKSEVITDA